MAEIWETSELMDVQYSDAAAPPDGWWLNRFFGRRFTSETQEIYFDQIQPRDRRLAPFVSPNVQGRMMKSRGRSVASFAPAYLKPKHKVDPTRAIPRRAGESIASLGSVGGRTLTLEERYDAAVADNVRAEREMIERRWDHMGCKAIIDGEVTVKGEDYPEVTVSFGRDPSLTATLIGDAMWSDPDASPLGTIGMMRTRAFPLGRAPITDIIFGADAWNSFEGFEETRKLLDNMRRGSESNFNTTGLTDGSPVEYVGQISGPNGAGRLDLWKYANEYEEEAEDGTVTSVPYLHASDIVGVGKAVGGVQAFGAIMDKKAGLKALPIFPKMWENEDPSGTFTMSQSAPLMVPTNPNNTFRVRVQ